MMSPLLKLLVELGPLAAFFVTYRFYDLMAATAVLIPATLLALGIAYVKEKKVVVMPVVTAIAVTVFGGLTLYLQDELFIKMKPTLVNLLFAAILLGGVLMRKPLLKYVLGEAFPMEERGWMLLSRRWGLYFIFLAALNEVIWRFFSTDFWVNFKVFGMFTLTICFTLCQLPLMKKYGIEETASTPDNTKATK